MSNSIYFDYAAATPMSDTVFNAMRPYFTKQFYNPSAQYLAAGSVKHAITRAREETAEILGCRPSEIIFTAGGTESDNLAIRGIMEKFPGSNCIVSAVEHDAVLEPAKDYEHKLCPVQSDGRIDIDALKKLIDDKTVLISVMYANNEIGTVQPLHDIARIVKNVRQERLSGGNELPLYFHTDAAQAANYLPLLVNSLGVDLMSVNGGKMYGPKQSGILFVKSTIVLSPQITGGGQERGLRSGTENVPSIIGFASALKEAADMREGESLRLRNLQEFIISRIESKLPNARLNGSRKFRLPNNVHLTFSGRDNEALMMRLDEAGYQVAAGSACSASSDEPSHVLKAIGMSDEDARSSLRISMGRQTDETAASMLADMLIKLCI